MAIVRAIATVWQFLTNLVTVFDFLVGIVGEVEVSIHYLTAVPTLGSSTQRDAVNILDRGDMRSYKWRKRDLIGLSLSSNFSSTLRYPFR